MFSYLQRDRNLVMLILFFLCKGIACKGILLSDLRPGGGFLGARFFNFFTFNAGAVFIIPS